MNRYLILIALIVLICCCSNEEDNSLQKQGKKWQFDPVAPVINNGTDIIDLVAASDPSILKDDEGYKLYYTCVGVTQEEIDAAAPLDPIPISRICVAVSADGIAFTRHPNNPILGLSESGWDSDALETPFAMKIGGEYWLYYNGKDAQDMVDVINGDKNTLGSIGLAISSDGITFAKSEADPVLNPSPLTDPVSYVGSWDSWVVEGPCIIEVESEYWMYYGGAGSEVAGEMINSIGLAKSSDGINWTKAFQNPIINEGNASSWDRYHVIDPSVVRYNNRYMLWYHGGDMYFGHDEEYSNFNIGVAYSVDGIGWSKDSSNPALENNVLDWTSSGIMAPSVIEESDKFVMYFHGLNGTSSTVTSWAIGRATLSK